MFGLLFDLDGTIINSAPDLIDCLQKFQYLDLTNRLKDPDFYHALHLAAGHSARAVLELLMPEDQIDTALIQKFFNYYKNFMHQQMSLKLELRTKFFPQLEDLLLQLHQAQIPWGIVTNRCTELTSLLQEYLPTLKLAGCVICGDTLEVKKPHPEPVLLACELLDLAPEKSWFIGDTEFDILAGRAANLSTLAVHYNRLGRPAESHAIELTADRHAHSPAELVMIIEQLIVRNSQT